MGSHSSQSSRKLIEHSIRRQGAGGRHARGDDNDPLEAVVMITPSNTNRLPDPRVAVASGLGHSSCRKYQHLRQWQGGREEGCDGKGLIASSCLGSSGFWSTVVSYACDWARHPPGVEQLRTSGSSPQATCHSEKDWCGPASAAVTIIPSHTAGHAPRPLKV